MKVGGIYKAQYSVYDLHDLGTYTFEIISERQVDGYYLANLVGTNHVIHFYPPDWSEVAELSSLEKELL